MKVKKTGKDKFYLRHNDVEVHAEILTDPPFGKSLMKNHPIYRYALAQVRVKDGQPCRISFQPTDHYVWGRRRLSDVTNKETQEVETVLEACDLVYKQWNGGRWVKPDETHLELAKRAMRGAVGAYKFHLLDTDFDDDGHIVVCTLMEMIMFLKGERDA